MKRDLNNCYIQYKDKLNLPKDISFGIEIEYENIEKNELSKKLNELKKINSNIKYWKNVCDISITEYYYLLNKIYNGEVISPILYDNETTWETLKIITNLLKNNNGIITNKCGGHVNIGTQIFGKNVDYWRNFFLLWILYEKEIREFSSGEYCKVRSNKYKYINRVKPILLTNMSDILQSNLKFKDYINNVIRDLSYNEHDISLRKVYSPFFEVGNVIEIRLPNGTLEETVWQNYINFFAKFMISCRKNLDVEQILYNIKHHLHSKEDLCDLIFDEEIDKVNFLIQTQKQNKVYNKKFQSHIKYKF